ncbi:MAG: PadR family transcriptional regulator [Oscillospiraceae bacterium]|nr:PadR family transcriptional regulator [Oscillospiraceae bacterium]MBR4195000.1 PadR family transcriptional regulator [Oscillospiraceae bacterium]
MSEHHNAANYQRGVASLVLLSLLKQSDMYGYQLVQEMERQSFGALCMQEGALYPVLYKLQDSNCISAKRVLVGKRMTRIYYHLEPEGRVYLEQLIQEYKTVVQGVLRIVEGESNVPSNE